eukprot:scaffold2205_cov183-Ochromonas_danica.AAC.28
MEEENIAVVVRIRPMQTNEKKNGDIPCVKAMADGREVQVKVGPLDAQTYRCSRCFNADSTQSVFFDECGITDLLDSAIDGYRACAFAFGQTGAGKTFTMFGGSKSFSHRDKNIGLIARSLDYIFTKLTHQPRPHPYRIRIACLEIYQEHVYDLMAEERDRISLAVREHANEGFFLEGCRLIECKDYEIACAVLDAAIKTRQVGEHDLNARSSRSHVLTEIHIESTPVEGEASPENIRGKMTLVDLAGSERLKSTNSSGRVRQEAGFINRSLYVLGKVIAGLVRTNGDLNHKDVPYRDSKLTKLLIASLGGNGRTLMVSCVSEAKGSQAETLRTLKFSMSCARIRNKPVKFLDPQQKLILDLKDEVRRLRHENRQLRSTLITAPSGHYSDDNLSSPSSSTSKQSSHARSYSANSPSRLQLQESPKRTFGQGAAHRLRPKKTHKQPRKMLETKSDIFANYPQLRKILERADQLESHDRLRPQFRSAPRLPPKASQVLDALLQEEMEEEEQSVKRRGSTENSVASSSPSNRRVDELSRLPGPMVFKESSLLTPVRQNHAAYEPAQNYVKAMESKRIEMLELRVRQMEERQLL